MSQSRSSAGATLLELMVTLALLGIVAGVAGLSLQTAGFENREPPHTAQVAAARREALHHRRPIATTVVIDGRAYPVTAHPDGSVLADTLLGTDRLIGRSSRAR